MQERYIASVDLGSTKIALSVAKVTGENVQVIYYKEAPSDGIRYSCVFNPKRAAAPLKRLIAEAESELGIKILQAVVGLPRYNVHQETSSATLTRSNPETCIEQEEIEVLKSEALNSYPLDNESKEEIYGAVAQSFSADDLIQQSEIDVVGATADKVDGNFKIFVGERKASYNIDILFNEVEVAPAHKIFLPDAVASAVLREDEKENGVALIEIGGGVTSVTIYQGKLLRYYKAIPFGGRNVTTDIKYEGGFKESLAENIKLAFGACIPEKIPSLGEKIIQINDDETGTYQQLPVKYLSEVITCRVKEILDAILYLIQDSGFAERLRCGVVLTGGCANLANICTLVKEMSGYNVRMGYPRSCNFSSAGCFGTNETGAAASIGLILAAKADNYLNCTTEKAPDPEMLEEPEMAEEPEEEEIKEAESYENTIFDTEAHRVEKPRKSVRTEKPRTVRTKPPKPTKPSFLNIIWNTKIKDGLSEAFDGVVGNLYDQLEDGNE